MKQSIENQNKSDITFNNLELKKIEDTIVELRAICDELDPYSPISDSMKNRLKKFHIVDTSNPFHLTNVLITLLEDAIEAKERQLNLTSDFKI